MKTLKDALKNVPLQTRLQIIEAIRKHRSEGLKYLDAPLYRDGLAGFFTFSDTRQGHRYWAGRREKISRQLNA